MQEVDTDRKDMGYPTAIKYPIPTTMGLGLGMAEKTLIPCQKTDMGLGFCGFIPEYGILVSLTQWQHG